MFAVDGDMAFLRSFAVSPTDSRCCLLHSLPVHVPSRWTAQLLLQLFRSFPSPLLLQRWRRPKPPRELLRNLSLLFTCTWYTRTRPDQRTSHQVGCPALFNSSLCRPPTTWRGGGRRQQEPCWIVTPPASSKTTNLHVTYPCPLHTHTRHFYCALKRSRSKNSIDHRIHDIISFVLFIPQEIPVIHQLLWSMEMDRRRRRRPGFDRAQFKHAVKYIPVALVAPF